ncbi:MAG: O-methyltransferase [Lachnospiraceae bacterium]|nr:O-methyltransferase [Lachnospiraceae bacterium]
MIVEERMTAYIQSLEVPESEICGQMRKEALRDGIPIIRVETASLLRLLIQMHRPARILEVGTAIGYSAILMSECMPTGSTITTIEKYEPRIPVAKAHIRQAGKEDCITLLEGDALEIMKQLDGTYDFIFMDAAKGQYIHFLPEVMRLLPMGGLLVSDNVLQDGDVVESRFAVTRRNRTIHSRMREYLYELKHHAELQTAVLSVGDGVTVSYRLTKKTTDA